MKTVGKSLTLYIYISFVLEYTMWQALDLKPWTHSRQSNKTVHGFNIIDPKGFNIYIYIYI